jgi:hypothetical protein
MGYGLQHPDGLYQSPSARFQTKLEAGFGEWILIERVDLLLLSVKAPLVDAVCATVCKRWQEASDLWLAVFREPRYRTLAALCGLEATLHAGLYDLAQYFYLAVEGPTLPEFLAEPWRQSIPVRRNRARFYAEGQGASCSSRAGRPAQYLLSLRLYRETIRDVFRRGVFEANRRVAVQLLGECYFALGEYEALIALYQPQRRYFVAARTRIMLEHARVCAARETIGQVENTLEFVQRHPAGFVLAPLLKSPKLMSAPNG